MVVLMQLGMILKTKIVLQFYCPVKIDIFLKINFSIFLGNELSSLDPSFVLLFSFVSILPFHSENMFYNSLGFLTIPSFGSLSVFHIWVPNSGFLFVSLFKFLIWLPYAGSLFGFFIRVPYLGFLFRFHIQVPYSGSSFWFLV